MKLLLDLPSGLWELAQYSLFFWKQFSQLNHGFKKKKAYFFVCFLNVYGNGIERIKDDILSFVTFINSNIGKSVVITYVECKINAAK